MPTYRLEIAGYVPVSTNTLIGAPRRAAIRAKKSAKARIAFEASAAGVPRVALPRPMARDAKAKGIDPGLIPIPWPAREPCRRLLTIAFAPGPERIGGKFAPGGQEPDPDNLLKATLDALVDGGWLVDDSDAWLDWRRPEILPRRAEPTLILTLEDPD